jgi:DNA-binding transcriptional MerR regulator
MSTDTLAARPETAARSIGEELERVRLEHRATRIGFVVAELRQLAELRAADGEIPAPLRQAINGFTQELEVISCRLRDLSGEPQPARRIRLAPVAVAA